jgi:hypothetical protein
LLADVDSGHPDRALRGYAGLLGLVLDGDVEALVALGTMLGYRVGLDSLEGFSVACQQAGFARGHLAATYNFGWSLIQGTGVRAMSRRAIA